MASENGWPDAAQPGVPANTDEDGCHRLQHYSDPPQPFYWEGGYWQFPSQECDGPTVASWAYHYLGPCLLPPEVAAQVAAARRAGIEEAANELKIRAATLRSWKVHNVGADWAEHFAACLRALLEEPTP